MKLLIKVPEGEFIPAWYGVGWHDWAANRVVCLPLGLNLVVGVARWVYYSVKHSSRAVMVSPRAAYQQGLNQARHLPKKDSTP